MPNVSGLEIKAAIKKASAWGTPVACGANDGILLMADSLKKNIDDNPDDSLGVAYIEDSDLGHVSVEGALPSYLRYDSHDVPLALATGAAGTPSQQGGTSAYANSLTLADNNDGIFGTIAINKVINVFEYITSKISGFTIKGETGKPVEIEYDVMASDEDPASATNDLTSFANVTYVERSNRVLFSQGVFRLNNESDGALGGGDVIAPSMFELSFKRNVKGEYVAGGSNLIDEPSNEGLPEVTLKLTFPRYAATTYLTAFAAETRKKADITFTGSLIEGAYYRVFKLQFPNLKITEADATSKKEKVSNEVMFRCQATTSAPTGMSGILKPFQIDVINTRTTSPLA